MSGTFDESLCVGVCMTDEEGYCIGCGRPPYVPPVVPQKRPDSDIPGAPQDSVRYSNIEEDW